MGRSTRVSPARVHLLLALVSALLIGLLFVSVVSAVPVATGHRGPVFGTAAEEPTQDRPQSKVWYHDGKWWAGMFDDATDANFIYRLDGTSWTKTSTPVDDRNDSHADYLWDGSRLHVVSVNGDSADDPIEYYRYAYASGTWSMDQGPTQVGLGPSESVAIAKSGNNLWITFTNPVDPANLDGDRKVMVNNSTNNGAGWTNPTGTQLSAGGTPVVTDFEAASAIVGFSGGIGILWSDQRTGVADDETEFLFSVNASPSGTTFAAPETAASGDEDFAEDHVNLKADPAGRVLAAVKTDGGPHVHVLARSSGGSWSSHVVVSNTVEATRPQLVINSSTSEAWVFYTIPVLAGDGDQRIYYKKASLGSLSFPSGDGTLFINDSPRDVNNISLPKQLVTSTSGVLGIASNDENDSTNSYYHNLVGATAPTPSATASPTPKPSATASPTPKPTATASPAPSNPFKDVSRSNKFYNDILWAYTNGITVGCPPYDRFCPEGQVTRAQMATFLVRALDLPAATGPDRFDDDDGNIHEARINALAQAGITVGCGRPSERRFCPDGLVTREQMATFLVRGYDLPPSSTDWFSDDDDSKHEARINALRASDITRGCGPTRFCPSGVVTRQQMAAFIHRAETR